MGFDPNTLIEGALANLPSAPPEVLHAELARATAAGEDVTLSDLIARDDVTAAVAAQHVTAGSVGAYLTRTDPDPDVVAQFAPSVRDLVEAINAGDPAPAVVAAAIARITDKRPAKLLQVALFNCDPSLFTPEQVRRIVDPAPDLVWNVYAERGLWLYARLGPDVALEVLRSADNPYAIAMLALFDLPVEEFVAALDRTRAFGRPSWAHLLEKVVDRLLERSTDREATWDILATSTMTGVAERLIGFRKAFNATRPVVPHEPWDTTPATPPSLGQDPRQIPLERAARSNDPARLTEIADEVLRRKTVTGWLELLSNPALRLTDRHRLLEGITEDHQRQVGHRDDLDGVIAFHGDTRSVQLWAHAFVPSTLLAHGWEPYGGRQVAPRLLAAWRREDPRDLDRRIAAAVTIGIRPAELLELSCEHIAQAVPRLQSQGGRASARYALSAAIAQVLTEHLGDNEARWAAYRSLAPTFEGTLGELLTVTRTLCE